MSSRLFSSVVMLALINNIGGNKDLNATDGQWAETIDAKHGQELRGHPVVFLTEEEDSEARAYLAWYKESDLDIADDSTRAIRSTHVAEIVEFLKTTQKDDDATDEHGPTVDERITFPINHRTPTSFDEWYIVTSIWRLTLAMANASYQDAAFGSGDCCINSLPKEWVEKLNECLKTTDPSAAIPAPKGPNLPIKRRHLDSILPATNEGMDLSGFSDGIILEVWCQILRLNREQRKPGCTVMIPPHSLELATATPIEVAENTASVNNRIDMIVFPTIIKEQDHCILVVAYPQKHTLAIYDSLGSKSTKELQKSKPWLEESSGDPEDEVWQVMWMGCPQQGEEFASGVSMFINAMFVILGRSPRGKYTPQDTLFLRRFVAAVICMGKLPEIDW